MSKKNPTYEECRKGAVKWVEFVAVDFLIQIAYSPKYKGPIPKEFLIGCARELEKKSKERSRNE